MADTILPIGLRNVEDGLYQIVDGIPTKIDATGVSVGDVVSVASTSPLSYEHTTPSGGGGSALTIKDEGTPLATAATSIDFVGAGVTVSGTTGAKTVTIPGGGGGGTFALYDRRKPRATNALDIDFTTATAWPAGWSVYNSADFHTSDWNTTAPGGLYLYAPASDSTFRGRYRAWPSGDGSFLLGVSMPVRAENYQLIGLRLCEGTSTATKGLHWRFGYHGGQGGFSVHAEGETGGSIPATLLYPMQTTDVFLQIYRVGTTYTFAYSMDGSTWFKTSGYTPNFTVANLAIVMYNATPGMLECQLHTFRYQPTGALQRIGGLRTVAGS